MSVAAMGAGDVVVDAQGFANAHGHGFFAAVKMRQSRHECAGVELVDLLFKQADADHLAVDAEPLVFFRNSDCSSSDCSPGGFSPSGRRVAMFGGWSHGVHFFLPPAVTGVETPDMTASTSNMQA